MASFKFFLLFCALLVAATASGTSSCPKCPHGQVCAGTSKVKKCVTPMKEGGRCGVDPFWICATGLRCKKHVCVPRKVRCPKCLHGKVCAGTSKVKKCVTPMKEGGRCGVDPFWVCVKGLRCKSHVCIPRKVRCPKCSHGQVCAGTSKVKKCVTPMKEGGRCGVDPFWICVKGLRCKDHICVARKARCPKCTHGKVCAGTSKVKKCVTSMKEGGRCGVDPFWVCEKGLRCVSHKCVRKH